MPSLFAALPDEAPSRDALATRLKYWHILSLLRALCHSPDLFEILVIRLTTKVELLSNASVNPNEDSEPKAAYAHSLLKTIEQTLTAKVGEGDSDVAKHIDRFIPRLYGILLFASLLPSGCHSIATDPQIILVVGSIISLVVSGLSQQYVCHISNNYGGIIFLNHRRQEAFASELFAAFEHGDLSGISGGLHRFPSDTKFQPFEVSVLLLRILTI
jgi:DNA repair/transcription protein MET18/MMS19